MPLSRARFMVRFGLALLLVGVVAFGFIQFSANGGAKSTAASLVMFGAFVVGGSGLLVAWVGWRTLRLVSAGNVIARWTVTPAEWQRYIAACQMRVTQPAAYPGAVPLDLPVPDRGIEVLALRRGFRVGDSFHELGGLSAEILDMRVVDSPAHLFEFNVLYATGKTSSVRLGVRIPIAENAGTLASQVEDHWIRREPLQLLSLEALRARERSGWFLSIVGLVAFIGVVALFIMINPPGWAAVAPVGSLGLAGYGFARGIKARSIRWRKETAGPT